MTRLFLRFYIGVLLILTAAGLLQSWLYGKRMEPVYSELARDVYFGGIRIARQKYLFGQQLKRRAVRENRPDDYNADERLFSEIQDQYDFPVRLHSENPNWDFGIEDDRLLLCRGIDIGAGEGRFIMARIRAGQEPVLLFGPLPDFAGPPEYEVLLGLVAVLALTALAIALLLRPVVRQFQLVEHAADTIATGDLTTRIEPEQGLSGSKLVQAFNRMANRTETMVQNKEELLQSVSHELRTPLSRIHFAADLLRTADPERREAKLQALESATDDLDKLVGELLTYARADNPPAAAPDEVSVLPIVTMTFEKHRLQFPNIDFETTDSLSTVHVTADPDGFERVISNLISNAARHAKSRVHVNAIIDTNRVTVEISDDGPGISETDRSRVFEPFVSLDDSPSGVGLGLAIVRRIVERNNGHIEITDATPTGCLVRTIWRS
ncbi:MAG: ATP-binding protein [Planctomycetaceae bacterium]